MNYKKLIAGGLAFALCVGIFLSVPQSVASAPQVFLTPKNRPVNTEINFINGSFETPDIFVEVPYGSSQNLNNARNNFFNCVMQIYVPGWNTEPVNVADRSNQWAYSMDIIRTGHQNTKSTIAGVQQRIEVAADGVQFAELNAQVPGTLYQVCNTIPGQKVYYEFYHMGRLGQDVMDFFLYNNDGGSPNSSTLIRTCKDGYDGTASSADSIKTVTNGTNTNYWGRYVGRYTVPQGQTKTVFAFQSVSAAHGSPNIGNYLDDIKLFYPGFLELEKSVSTSGSDSNGPYAMVGETVTYTIKISNTGECDSSRTVFNDALPDGVEFIANSIKINGAPAGALGTYDEGTRSIRVNLGEGATTGLSPENGGSIAQDASYTVTFRAKVTGEGKKPGDLIQNQAKATYNDKGFEAINEYEDEWNASNIASFTLKESNVSGTVWVDADENGKLGQPLTERRISGATVRMIDAATGQTAKSILGDELIFNTDTDGKYLFKMVPSGDYKIVYSTPTGYRTSVGTGDNKAQASGALSVIQPVKIDLAQAGSGVTSITGQDIGIIPTISITKTAQVNNGAQNPGTADKPVDAKRGDTITYTISVKNNGTDAINKPFTVTDLLPKSFGVSQTPALLPNDATVTQSGERMQAAWSFASLPAGEKTFKVIVAVEQNGLMENTAAIQDGISDPIKSNTTYHYANSVSIDIHKTLTEPSEEDEQFVFRVDYRPQANAEIARSFYGIVTVQKGSTEATIQFAELTPGHYTVTEESSNWRYKLKSANGLSAVVTGFNDSAEFTFTNERTSDRWISGKSSVTNTMEALAAPPPTIE